MPLTRVVPEKREIPDTPEGFVVISTELFASFMAKWNYKITDWGKPHPMRTFSPDTAHFFEPVVMTPTNDID